MGAGGVGVDPPARTRRAPVGRISVLEPPGTYTVTLRVGGKEYNQELELLKDPHTKEPLRRATEKYSDTVVKQVSEYLFKERDVYVPGDKFGVWVVPPLVVTRDELDFVIDAIDDALALADAALEG